MRSPVTVCVWVTDSAEPPSSAGFKIAFTPKPPPTLTLASALQTTGTTKVSHGTLATAGGLSARGTEKGIRLHRRGPDGKVQVIQPGMDDPMRDGDVLYVRESLF